MQNLQHPAAQNAAPAWGLSREISEPAITRDPLTLKLVITGHFPEDIMVCWIIRRASLLDLSGWVKYVDRRIEIEASGERVLVEALEVACSLGPIEAQIDTIHSDEIPTTDTLYRQPRQFIRY